MDVWGRPAAVLRCGCGQADHRRAGDLAREPDLLTAVEAGGDLYPAVGDRERVFERFTRLDDSRARPQGGSGLGLAVVRAIVSRHRGQIRIEDSPLGGARVVVELPAGSRPETLRSMDGGG
jgi:signal transduction histidine kinase